MRSPIFYILLLYEIFLLVFVPAVLRAQENKGQVPGTEIEEEADFTPLDLSCFSDSDPEGKAIFVIELIKKIKKKEILTLNMDIPSKDKKPKTEKKLKFKVSLDGGDISTGIRFEIKK